MSTMSALGAGKIEQQDILLESGTNEVEVLAFGLADERYGVNVAKVREVIRLPKMIRVPHVHEVTDGVFKLREDIVPLLNLRRYFGLEPGPQSEEDNVIVTEFSNVRVAFRVDHVDRIYRVSYNDVGGLPGGMGAEEAAVTAIAQLGEELVMMVDFERLVMSIGGIQDFERYANQIENTEFNRSEHRLLHAEDSPLMRKTIEKALVKSGYTQLTSMKDGEEARDWHEANTVALGDSTVELVITDIEMTKMDGLHLTKRIKAHPLLKDIPVIVFSSLVSPDNEKKCKAVGADMQITKPELGMLVGNLDRLLKDA